MATVKTFRKFYLILLLYINLPMNTAEVVIALQVMTPVLNTKFYVLCDITVSTEEEDEQFLDQDVIIEGKNLKCTISGWKFCNKVPPPQVHGACGCNYKKLVVNSLRYRFYLLVNPVSEDFIGSQFICQLNLVKDSRQMEVVRFTKSPERILYTCKNTTLQFDWEFNPSREIIRERFTVSRISWTSVALSGLGSTRYLGTYYLAENGTERFNSEGSLRSNISYSKGKIPQLIMSDVQLADSKQSVTINVTFDPTKMLHRRKRVIQTNTSELLSFGHTNNTGGGDEDADVNDVVDVSTTAVVRTKQTSITTLKATTAARQTQQAITTPMPVEMTLDTPENHVVDTVHLIVTEAPSQETRVTIKAYESLTGNLVISCQVQFMTFDGDPPVNVTIWHDEKRLITRSGITVLHYSTVVGGKFISCGLEGHALDCLHEGDPRRQQVTFDLKDLEKSVKPMGGVDLLLSLYAWESIICIVLVCWVTSLLLDHIRFVVRKAKHELEAKNRALLEA